MKRLWFVVLLLASMAQAQTLSQYRANTIQRCSSGTLQLCQAYLRVQVCPFGAYVVSCPAPATIYSAPDAVVPTINPFYPDAYGNALFYAPPGYYTVQYLSAVGAVVYQEPAHLPALGGTLDPVDVGVTFNGKPTASMVLVRHPFPFAVAVPLNCAHSKLVIEANPTATWTATLLKNDVPFGSVSCSTGSVCTFTCTATAFAEGDVLKVIAPASPDATAALFGGAIYATRAGGVQ